MTICDHLIGLTDGDGHSFSQILESDISVEADRIRSNMKSHLVLSKRNNWPAPERYDFIMSLGDDELVQWSLEERFDFCPKCGMKLT